MPREINGGCGSTDRLQMSRPQFCCARSSLRLMGFARLVVVELLVSVSSFRLYERELAISALAAPEALLHVKTCATPVGSEGGSSCVAAIV